MPEPPTVAHGLDLVTDLPLRGLRKGTGRRVEVVPGVIDKREGDLVGEWEEIPGRRARTTVRLVGKGSYVVAIGSMAEFLVDTQDGRITAAYRPDLPEVLQTTLLMSTPVALFLYEDGLIGLHAGAVEVDGKALLISGTGSGGKTTLTTAFHIHGHRLLGEDLAAVDPRGRVHPAQAVVRLRRESADRIGTGLGDAIELWETDGQRHYEIAPDRRGTGDPVPIAAIIVIEWGEERPRLEPVPSAPAIQELWDKSFYLADGQGARTSFDRLGALVDAVPAYRLTRPKDFEALGATVELLAGVARSGDTR